MPFSETKNEIEVKWKQTLNNRWSKLCRYVTGRLQWYPQETAESFVKWSSASLLHSPGNLKCNNNHGRNWNWKPKLHQVRSLTYLQIVHTHTHTHICSLTPSKKENTSGILWRRLVLAVLDCSESELQCECLVHWAQHIATEASLPSVQPAYSRQAWTTAKLAESHFQKGTKPGRSHCRDILNVHSLLIGSVCCGFRMFI